MATTKNLVLTLLVEAQQNAATAVNSIANLVDALTQGVAINETNTPPGSPGEGDVYIVGTAGTGAWAGESENIAINLSGWVFVTPKEGWTMYDQTADVMRRWNGTNWINNTLAANNADLTDNSTGSDGGAVADGTASYSQTIFNNNMASIAGRINGLHSVLQSAGLMGA